MKKYTAFFVLYLLVFLAAGSLFAQGFVGPGAVNQGAGNVSPSGRNQAQAVPIAASQVGTVPHNSWVILTGNIISSVSRDYYTFRDSSGEITVEIERKYWGNVTVGPSDRVELTAQVEIKRGGRIDVEVKAVRRI